MSGSKLVSVIVPCYNQARFLSEAIESILQQEYSMLEVIVIDDGSSDDTAGVATSYRDVRFIRQSNQGLSKARNKGLIESRGEYVTFLDADDRLLPRAIETGVRALDQNPDWALVYGHYRYIDANGDILPVPARRPVIIEDSYEGLLRHNFICMHGAVMYRRAVLELVGGFNPSLRFCEDYDLYLRIARLFPIGSHDELVAEYRIHGQAASRNHAGMLKTGIKVLHSQCHYIKENERYRRAYEEGLRAWREGYGNWLVEDIRARIHERKEWMRLAEDLLTLLLYYPRGFTLHGFRKMKYAFTKYLWITLLIMLP